MRTLSEIDADLDAIKSRKDRISNELDGITARAVARGGPDIELTPGESEKLERLTKGIDKLKAEQEALELERHEVGVDLVRRQYELGAIEVPDGWDHPEHRRGLDAPPGVARALRVVDTAQRDGLLSATAAAKVEQLVTHGPTANRGLAARWATETGHPAYLGAFAKLVQDPARGHLTWTPEEAEAYRRVAAFQAEQRAMSLTDTAGGFMVPLTLDPAIILSSDGSISALRRISRVVQTVTNEWNGVTSAGVTASWDAEAAEVSDDTPTLAQPNIPVHKGAAFVPFSLEIGMDAVNFTQQLGEVLADAADTLQAAAYAQGTGTSQPTGIITALDGTASEVTPATAETFAATDVYAVQNALPPRFQARAAWCAEISTINKMAQFETTNGARLFPEITNDRLLRKPLHEVSDLDAFGDVNPAVTADNHVLLYGDFRHFVIVDRIGTTVELIPHLFATANNRPSGQRGLYMYFRTGSDAVVDGAFRVLNVATTL